MVRFSRSRDGCSRSYHTRSGHIGCSVNHEWNVDRHIAQTTALVFSWLLTKIGNTSHLDVFPLVPERRQARCLIAHWYTPPYVIDLVDLAPGPATTPEVMQTMRALYDGFGKAPIVFDSLVSGYIANRLQSAMNLEIFRLLDEGRATAHDIDASIRHGLALRLATLGHLKKTDYTGLEMARRALANRTYTPPTPTGHSRILDDLIAAGRTGVMAGAGFYDYGDTAPAELFRRRDVKLLRLKKALQEIEKEPGS